MVGADGALALPWLEPALERWRQLGRAHALLLHGPQGVGQFEMALTIAQGWLCEAATLDARPCGTCASCRLVQAHTHPDLLVLVPDAQRAALGWSAADDEGSNAADRSSKAKPSKEIRVEAVRTAVAFAQTTSARGRGKAVVLHPAERMNAVSANTLLKTLEEPSGDARFVLGSAAPDALLPTIRSRCQQIALAPPPATVAAEWLTRHGVAAPEVLLAATGGQPQLALEWAGQGVDAVAWTKLPRQIRSGDAATLSAWPMPRLVDALQKLCHDEACVVAGAAPRYFPAAALGGDARADALSGWMRELARAARHAEHPWSAGLMAEALVEQGRRALAGGRTGASPAPAETVHSRR